jgi:hypothetical protein
MNLYNVLLLQLPIPVNYGEMGVHTLLIIGIVSLSSAVVYLYHSKDKAIKKKDAQIMQVIKEHQDDLKAENQTMKDVMEKYNQFTQSIKEIYAHK